jgi:hypothetical protein
MARGRKRKWTDEQLIEAVKKSHSISDVLKHLGVTSRPTVIKQIKKLGLDLSRLQSRPSGIKDDGDPNAYWRKFKDRLDSYADTPIANWKNEHFLGHILKRYKDEMKVDFGLSYSGPPTKCKEIYCVRRMVLALGTDNPHTIKEYIDWVFDKNIIPSKVIISSIAFFFATGLILNFKAELRKRARITRATELPSEIQNLAVGLELDIRTYGDLAFAKVALEDDPENEDLDIYSHLFVQLREMGFDEDVLSTLEG